MEELIPFLVVIGYLIVNFLGKFVERQKNQAPSEGSSDPSAVDQMLREMMRQAGFEPEQPALEEPVASEHRPTRSEHRPTRSEHRPTRSEHQATRGEHMVTASEHRGRLTEHMVTASEHQFSLEEHRKGDVRLPPVPGSGPVVEKPPTASVAMRSEFGKSVIVDLQAGPQSLARAILLSEILGPPVSMRERPN